MKQITDNDIANYFGAEVEEVINKSSIQNKTNIFNTIKEAFNTKKNIQERIKSLFSDLVNLSKKDVHILIVGASGSGKSETINALLKDANIHNQKAISRKGSDSVTMNIETFKIGNCSIYDSPGLGDNLKLENQHIFKIKEKLKEVTDNGQQLIDLVVVILNASNLRNLKSEYEIINEILVPNLENHQKLIIALNKTDLFDDGDNWDKKRNKPTQLLRQDIEIEINKLKNKIKDSTGIDVNPIYYSAGRKDRNKKPWNLIRLYEEMNKNIAVEKKISLGIQINTKDNFENSENFEEVKKNIEIDVQTSLEKSIREKMRQKNKDKEEESDKESEGWLSKIIAAFTGVVSLFSW